MAHFDAGYGSSGLPFQRQYNSHSRGFHSSRPEKFSSSYGQTSSSRCTRGIRPLSGRAKGFPEPWLLTGGKSATLLPLPREPSKSDHGKPASDSLIPSSLIPPAASPNADPPVETDVAFHLITSWLENDRAGPIDIRCTSTTFHETVSSLSIAGKLPRLARDYDADTMSWHITKRPHFLHEIGNIVLGEIKGLTVPLLPAKFGKLAQKLVWNSGSNTSKLAAESFKEPDASIGMLDRALPTVVVEVGYSESRAKLRLDAARWLATGQRGQKRKRGDVLAPSRSVMLVILVSFEGQRPSEDFDIAYSHEDYDEGGNEQPEKPKPLQIFVELWRLRANPDPGSNPRTQTRSAKTLFPAICERKCCFPAPEEQDSEESLTFYATDLFGADMVVDPKNKVQFPIPVSLFRDAYLKKLTMFRAAVEDPVGRDEDDVVFVSDDEEEDGNDREKVDKHEMIAGELARSANLNVPPFLALLDVGVRSSPAEAPEGARY